MRTRLYAFAAASLASTLAVTTGWAAGVATATPLPRISSVTPTPVSACGPISVPGNYVLTDSPPPSAGSCFVVTAPHVTLDLAGHILAGTGLGAGVLLRPSAVGARIESSLPGAAIGGFATGVRDNASDAIIAGPDLVMAANLTNGVWVFDATGSEVEHLVLNGNHGYGVRVQMSGGVLLGADRVNASGIYGIWAQTSEGTRVLDDNVVGSGLAGIYLGCSGTGNLQNVSCGRPSEKSLVMQDTLVSNGDYGIAVADESLGNTFRTNHVGGDKANDLQDENFHCTGPTGTNQWQTDTGTRNQSVSPTCIG
jgi:hypothetical protein